MTCNTCIIRTNSGLNNAHWDIFVYHSANLNTSSSTILPTCLQISRLKPQMQGNSDYKFGPNSTRKKYLPFVFKCHNLSQTVRSCGKKTSVYCRDIVSWIVNWWRGERGACCWPSTALVRSSFRIMFIVVVLSGDFIRNKRVREMEATQNI
jgi:hypothetical protein